MVTVLVDESVFLIIKQALLFTAVGNVTVMAPLVALMSFTMMPSVSVSVILLVIVPDANARFVASSI
jgi:hypothetical protein